jgi:hypothetical protein
MGFSLLIKRKGRWRVEGVGWARGAGMAGGDRGRGVGVENVKANSKDKIFKCSESQSSLAYAIKLFILAIAMYLPFLHFLHKFMIKIFRC